MKKSDSQGLALTRSQTRDARTGILASSVRTISIAYVQLFVPENPRLIDVKGEGSNACESKPYATFPKRLVGGLRALRGFFLTPTSAIHKIH